MSEQLVLLAEQVAPEQPRCRMCARPAYWKPNVKEWHAYCSSGACTNRYRLCQACGTSFIAGASEGGSKYCSMACKLAGFGPDRQAVAVPCAWCLKDPPSRAFRGGKWPYICAECTHPIRYVVPRLKEHNVPHEMARRLLADSGCEVCGADLLERRSDTNGRTRPVLVVDHDHGCCPGGSLSCGRCIRGLICRSCNAAAGQLYDSADNARSLAAYLDRWKGAA